MTAPKPPSGTKTAGRRLWKAVLADFELDEHELTLLRQAAHVADLCDDLQVIVDADGPVLGDDKGNVRAHPAVVELRQQRLVLARLVVALRVPLGEGESVQGAPRLQRRALRGVYGSVS